MYAPGLVHPSLIVIGLCQPLGALMPISEMQARVACEYLLGVAQQPFPSRDEMLADIADKKNAMAAQYVKSRRHTIQVCLGLCSTVSNVIVKMKVV